MSSACVNNNAVGVPPSSNLAWLSPPSRHDDALSKRKPNPTTATDKERDKNDEGTEASDFEFHLDHPVAGVMLPADELFSDGKFMPMTTTLPLPKQIVLIQTSCGADPDLFSPRAPRCASRWKEIFGLKKIHHNSTAKTTSVSKSLKNILHRSSKSDTTHPFLRDSECESVSISSRLSLSSSSSGHELEDFPRLSLDTERHNNNNNINPVSLLKSIANSNPNNNSNPPPRIRLNAGTRMGKSPVRRTASAATEATTVSYADSPRMNPSGKIVFHGLERSSSSPGSFNGGPRFKHSISGMERSFSANVRVAPVLNVSVCSLSKSGNVLGLGQLFSNSSFSGGISTSSSRSYHSNSSSRRRNRT